MSATVCQQARLAASGALALLVVFTISLALPRNSQAQPRLPPEDAQARLCVAAIAVAERAFAIPSRLLATIALVESGRSLRGSQVRPWPWTIDANGQGYFYETKASAIAAARALRANGVQSVDIGCMQINLQWHPGAFVDLDQAFDPSMNCWYAARFLDQLFRATGSWSKAVALYHSATPRLGASYLQRISASLPRGIELRAAEQVLHPPANQPLRQLAAAWAATLEARAAPSTPP